MVHVSKRFAICVLAAGLLAGCVSASRPQAGPGEAALSVQALHAALVGNSIVATRVDGSGSYCAYHAPESRPGGSMLLHGVDAGQGFRGLYRVEARPTAADPGNPAFVCYSYPDSGVFADCRMVRSTGSQVAILHRDGDLYATGEILPGDQCGQGA